MTKKQLREHKQGNQVRKARLQNVQRTARAQDRQYWAERGLIQNGKWTGKV